MWLIYPAVSFQSHLSQRSAVHARSGPYISMTNNIPRFFDFQFGTHTHLTVMSPFSDLLSTLPRRRQFHVSGAFKKDTESSFLRICFYSPGKKKKKKKPNPFIRWSAC